MEIRKTLPAGIEKFRSNFNDGPIEYVKRAVSFTRENYGDEMDHISSIRLANVTRDFFFQEYMWVVHATGFSAKAVGKFLPKLIPAYGPWRELGNEDFKTSFDRIKLVCNNYQKAHAVWSMAKLLVGIPSDERSWFTFKYENLSSPSLLTKLPYIGKITCYHLGRNIGLLDCVKPDLHLVRMAKYWGFKDCESMCREMQNNAFPDLPLGIIDLCLWYSASTFGTLEIREDGQR